MRVVLVSVRVPAASGELGEAPVAERLACGRMIRRGIAAEGMKLDVGVVALTMHLAFEGVRPLEGTQT